ncbi:MAG TPA: hypothetical protein PKM57_12015 [Kiritimatiellia bacterium]|nr:hypothetical protein [Kiritimatiellia bacterium]HPS08960.1 hypothetical protein [Kiritimatiellia bacterium]
MSATAFRITGFLCLWGAGCALAQTVAPDARAFAAALLGRATADSEAASPQALWTAVERHDEVLADWLRQDLKLASGPELFAGNGGAARFLERTAPASAPSPDLPSRLIAYRAACAARRALRLARVTAEMPRLVYARHFVMGGSHYAYTEALSDAQAERSFRAGGKLCVAECQDGLWKETVLTETKDGIIRDADVDFDGQRFLFALKKSDRGDDYHLYEMDAASREIRQLTDGVGVADYEGCYLPDGHIIFNSTRCMQIVDCWWTEVSNLYRCDRDGRNILRLSFDQVHLNYPAVTDDGRILYTRWEYNDRSQMYPQPLFQMASDGTQQGAVYGENSWFPTTIIHARGIPGSGKIFAVATGHHSRQPGDLILVDPAKGRQEAEGVTLVAPVRETKSVIVDAYGQDGDLFAYPYPIDERSLLVTYNPDGWERVNGKRHEDRTTGFGIYWMDVDGNRELLVSRQGLACGRPVPVRPRPRPAARVSSVDYSKTAGTCYVQDVYAGAAMAGVPRGTVKTLRVIGLDFRLAGIGSNGNAGPGGGALISTPPSVGNGAWDPKILVGDAPVHEDGSVFFTAGAREPFYFMLLDAKGRMVQTMRSWTSLQPGENASCVGCHESKNSVPLATARPTLALAAGARPLAPVSGPRRGFSFLKEIQPILDAHCVTCHDGKDPKKPDLTATVVTDAAAKRRWTRSYLALTHARPDHTEEQTRWRGDPAHKVLNWVSSASAPQIQKPLSAGSNASGLFAGMLDKGHCKTLTPDAAACLAMWVDLGVPFCGDYTEANAWTDAERAKYEQYKAKRDRAAAEDQATLMRLAAARP